jgi:hypothetical protein
MSIALRHKCRLRYKYSWYDTVQYVQYCYAMLSAVLYSKNTSALARNVVYSTVFVMLSPRNLSFTTFDGNYT